MMLSRMTVIAGFATVALSLAMLFAASMMAVFASKTAVIEQRVAFNYQREMESFTAAEAGLNVGLMHLNSNNSTIVVDTNSDGYIDAYTNAAITNFTLPGGAKFTVTYANPIANDLTVIQVTSVGTCADGTVTRTVKEIFANQLVFGSLPTSPMITQGDMTLGGNVRIQNMHSSTTIWSGGAVDLNGSADTLTMDASSNARAFDSDVNQNDTTLSSLTGDQFFQKTFNGSKASIKSRANLVLSGTGSDNYSSSLNGQTGKLIWIEQSSGTAQINGNVTIGSASNPVVVIVDGDLRINGNTTVYGVIYVGNDWTNRGGGNLNVNGSVLVEGDFSSTGTPDITFDNSVIDKLGSLGGSFLKLPGSWKDF